MNFWDASAIVALIVEEAPHSDLRQVLSSEPSLAVWWGTPVECASALARREREGAIEPGAVQAATRRLHALSAEWHEVLPSNAVRNLAIRMLRLHPLRAADSLQLAAAMVAAEHDPTDLGFVCLDERLALAAAREGFRDIRPGD